MSKVKEIQVAIESLLEEEYVRLRRWFSNKDWEKWDQEIQRNSDSGKIDFLIQEALEEKKSGQLKE